jgi:hypothetical protein
MPRELRKKKIKSKEEKTTSEKMHMYRNTG